MASKEGGATVYNIVLFAFAGDKKAGEVVKELKSQQKLEDFKIVAEAVVERDQHGRLHVHEPGEGGKGTAIGAVAGGVAGLFFGPLGIVLPAIVGGAIGGVAGHFAGREIPPEDMKRIGEALPLNSSALVVMVEDTEAERLLGDLSGYQANVVTLTIGDELSGVVATTLTAEVRPVGAAAATALAGAAPQSSPGSEAPAAAASPSAQQPAAAALPAATPSVATEQR